MSSSSSSSRSKFVPHKLLWILGSLVAVVLAIVIAYPQPDLDWDGTILPQAKRFMEEINGGGGKKTKVSSSQPLNGLVVAITGATSGIGLSLTRKLTELGATVIAIGRSSTKLESLFNDNSNVRTVLADLSDLDSIANASEYILKEYNHLDILVNNAGIHTGLSGMWDYSTTTKQGYDLTFGVNYLSHFLLTEKLMPLLSMKNKKRKNKKGQRKSKIVQISSSFHYAVDGTDLAASSETQQEQQPIASVPGGSHGFVAYRTQRQYANSKLAQIYHARSLVRKYGDDIEAVSACPTWVGTSIIGAPSNSISYKIFSKLAYPSDGYGLHSIFNAILDVEKKGSDDFYVNNYSPLTVMVDSLPSWTYSILPIRDIFVQSFGMGLLFTQRLFPVSKKRTKPKSSKASYDERIQEELYQWSYKAVSKWL